jgi:hypothetical protein
MKMYTDIEVSTSVEKAKATFPSTSGVKQGDNVAPVLFLFAIQAAAEFMSLDGHEQKPYEQTRRRQDRTHISGFQQVFLC